MQIKDEMCSVWNLEPIFPIGQTFLLVLLDLIEETRQVDDNTVTLKNEDIFNKKNLLFAVNWVKLSGTQS